MKTEKENTQAAMLAFKEHANAVNIQPYSFIVGYTAALKASQWIDADNEETQPEHGAQVLCVDKYGTMFLSFWVDSLKGFYIGGQRVSAAFWQPLPNPPEV